uniref:RNA-dependent RNA polymerase n=1 Tax=Vaccinium-associated virus C TaxID=3079058 RepID=A0AA96PMX7_9VIRU|nr:RNA-dependent RNA polymerase [Vaccinium-associated virus C]
MWRCVPDDTNDNCDCFSTGRGEQIKGIYLQRGTGFSFCKRCSGWRNPTDARDTGCCGCGRKLEPWWSQALGAHEADCINLINSNPEAPLNSRTTSTVNNIEHIKEELNRNNIPVWCNIRRGNLSVVIRSKCKYVLAHVTHVHNSGVAGYQNLRVGTSNISGIAVKCEDFWLYYIRTDMDIVSAPPTVRRAVSVAYSAINDYDYSDASGMRYLRRQFDVDAKLIAHVRVGTGPAENEFERSKVTGEHHTHFRPEELWKIATTNKASLRAMQLVLDCMRNITGITEAAVATFMLYILTARPQIMYMIACSQKIRGCKDVGRLVNVLKDLSTPLKSLQNHELADLSQMFELQTLVNRGIGKVDWEGEYEDRTKPDSIIIDPVDVYKTAMKVFNEGEQHGFKYQRMERHKYIKSRWEWVPAGSVHSQYVEDDKYIKRDYRHRTKFVTLNAMPAEHINKMFARRPQIEAWASIKYEWAKQRAIYGVDLTSSVITNFAMYRCEESLRHRFPIGEEAAATRVHKRLKMMLADSESFCYDFDNFNAQHSIGSMYAVLCAYRDYFKKDMSVEQQSAMEWVCNSVLDMTVNDNMSEESKRYKLKGTLLSGWRLTTFMNTILNYVYFEVSGALATRGVRDSVHNGDDVLLSVRNIASVVQIHKKMADINARAQPAKCNALSVGEFLRVEHKVSKENGLGAQYLSRACATAVHSRIESQAPLRLTDALKATVTRMEELSARSEAASNIAAMLLQMATERQAEIFKVSVDICEEIVRSHVIVGGALTCKTGKIANEIIEEVETLHATSIAGADRRDVAEVNDLLPGIIDYAHILVKQYEQYTDIDHVLRRVKGATDRQLSVTRGTRLTVVDAALKTRYAYGREMFGMYRGIINVPYVDKARFVGISPIAMLDQEKVKIIKGLIEHVRDVEYTLRVLL